MINVLRTSPSGYALTQTSIEVRAPALAMDLCIHYTGCNVSVSISKFIKILLLKFCSLKARLYVTYEIQIKIGLLILMRTEIQTVTQYK